MSLRKPAELAAQIRDANDEQLRSTVVAMRRMEPRPSFQAIAEAVGLSRSRVHQICVEELGEEGDPT